MVDERLGRHFLLSEFLRSETATRRGLANVPDGHALRNLREVLAPGLERVRALLGVPVQITSGYRSPAVNAAVGGSAASQHCHGLAADFVAPDFGTPRSIARHLAQQAEALGFDQLIFEGTWVHISFVPDNPRRQALTAHFGAGPVTYTKGIA